MRGLLRCGVRRVRTLSGAASRFAHLSRPDWAFPRTLVGQPGKWVQSPQILVCPASNWRLQAQEMKVSEMLRLLRADGWYLVVTRGSHRQYKHAARAGRVTVPGKPGDDLAPGTLNSILKQSGLKKRR